MSSPALSITGLTRRFGDVVANNDITLTIEPGTVLGLLGHNGAGKTTLVSQVVGLLRPHAGSIHVGGVDAVADPAAADFTFNIATPPSADALCSPLDTGGMWSCRNGDNVVINSDRWNWGAVTYPDVDSYRTYVTNHEVGHFLGHEHEFCAGAGLKAPLMAQQSHDLAGGCVYNAWPTQDNQPG